MSKDGVDSSFSIIVVELGDVVPRRDPDRPNLYVGKTTSSPDKRFAEMRRSKKARWYAGHLVALREDLAPRRTYETAEAANAALKEVITKLKKTGYTVNRDTKVWSVYVIELDSSAISDPGKGYVYVGETSLTPEERFEQHKNGATNKRGPLYSRVVKNHGKCLRYDLFPKRRFFDSASAKKAEKEHFEYLGLKGYKVKGGH